MTWAREILPLHFQKILPFEFSRSPALNAQPVGATEPEEEEDEDDEAVKAVPASEPASQPARPPERVAVAIFYNKTHLRVTALVVRSCGTMAL